MFTDLFLNMLHSCFCNLITSFLQIRHFLQFFCNSYFLSAKDVSVFFFNCLDILQQFLSTKFSRTLESKHVNVYLLKDLLLTANILFLKGLFSIILGLSLIYILLFLHSINTQFQQQHLYETLSFASSAISVKFSAILSQILV